MRGRPGLLGCSQDVDRGALGATSHTVEETSLSFCITQGPWGPLRTWTEVPCGQRPHTGHWDPLRTWTEVRWGRRPHTAEETSVFLYQISHFYEIFCINQVSNLKLHQAQVETWSQEQRDRCSRDPPSLDRRLPRAALQLSSGVAPGPSTQRWGLPAGGGCSRAPGASLPLPAVQGACLLLPAAPPSTRPASPSPWNW